LIEKISKVVLIIIGMVLFYQLTSMFINYYVLGNLLIAQFGVLSPIVISVIGGLIGGLILFIISPRLINWGKRTSTWIITKLQKTPINEIMYGFFGLIMGLIVANLLSRAFLLIPFVGKYLPILANIGLGYLGINIFLEKKEEISHLLPSGKFGGKDKPNVKVEGYKPKVLDTSVIIDGRIADICETGFLEGKLVIPSFVLDELRHIADSSDLLKRNRGRRGLDILNKIQKELNATVEIYEGDFEDIVEVDSKLVRLAQLLEGQIITNDYNLNKVAELQGVQVLNINELANAVKPVVLPGEEMVVQVIKDGKESGQGVAYLDDGTMIVVDGGRKHIGKNIGVLVTSVLQTAAGRMIFAKPKQEQKAL